MPQLLTAPAPYSPELFRALLREDFYSFGKYAFGVVRPGATLKTNWHLQAIAHKLSEVAAGRIRRLLITVPPRTLKSTLASVAFPAWFLGRNPAERVVVASYAEPLSRVLSNDFRALVNDPAYRAAFPDMRILRETDREILTTKRGKRLAVSIEGTLTGLGGNLIIVDDPIKQGDVFSEAALNRVIEWYRSTLLSRADDKSKASIVVVMQRVHQNDLAGYLQEQGGYEVLNLPAVAQIDEEYELGHGNIYTRKAGEILHPEHESNDVLRELKREMGPMAFAAQYQQNPAPLGGLLIKRSWLQHTYAELGTQANDRIIMSWDVALSGADTADYSACAVLLARREAIYVLEVVRQRLPFNALVQKIMELKQRYRTATLLIEQSSISLGLIQSLRERSINVVPYKAITDKYARVAAQTDLFAGGSIRLPVRAPWLGEFTKELLSFPGRHDDQVDALVQGIAYARDKWTHRAYVGSVRGLG